MISKNIINELLENKWSEGNNFFAAVFVKLPSAEYKNLKEGTQDFELLKCDVYDKIMDINDELKSIYGENVCVKNIKEEDIEFLENMIKVRVVFTWKEN